jgi:hypothetical protein
MRAAPGEPLDNVTGKRTLPEFAVEAAGRELWDQYCAALVRYYGEFLDETHFAIGDTADALRERWSGLRYAPQSQPYNPQIESFEAAIDRRIREQMQSGEFIMTGLVSTDERQVPPRLFRDRALRIWLDQSEVELPDGTVLRSVTVSRSEPAKPRPASPDRTSDKLKKKPTKQEAFKAWYRSSYPDENPPGTMYKQLAREFGDATKTRIDVRTVRRAFGKR